MTNIIESLIPPGRKLNGKLLNHLKHKNDWRFYCNNKLSDQDLYIPYKYKYYTHIAYKHKRKDWMRRKSHNIAMLSK